MRSATLLSCSGWKNRLVERRTVLHVMQGLLLINKHLSWGGGDVQRIPSF